MDRSYDGYRGNAAIVGTVVAMASRDDYTRLRTEQGSHEHGDRSEQQHLRTKPDRPRRRRRCTH
jgi:hypothetical protein